MAFLMACSFSALTVMTQTRGVGLIDSLVYQLKQTTNDTASSNLSKSIFDEYLYINVDSALFYAREGLRYRTRMNWPDELPIGFITIATAFSRKGNYDSSMHYYNKALALIEKLKPDSFNIANHVTALINMGSTVGGLLSDKVAAMGYYIKALELAEKNNDAERIMFCNHNIATIYSVQNNYEKALDYSFKALAYAGKTGYPDDSAMVMLTIGIVYYRMGDSTKAEEYFNKALPIYEKVGNKNGVAKTYSNLTLVKKDIVVKIEFQVKAIQLLEELGSKDTDIVIAYGNLGEFYLDLVRFDSMNHVKHGGIVPVGRKAIMNKSENYLLKSIKMAEEIGDIEDVAYFTNVYSQLLLEKRDFKNAYVNLRNYHRIHDSLFSQETKNKIAGVEAQKEVSIKNREIEINKLTLANQQKKLLAVFGTLLFVSIIGGLLFWQNRTRKKTNTTLMVLNNELDESNKIKTKFFSILSHDLRSPVANLINYLHLQQEAPDLVNKESSEAHTKKITASAENLLENMEGLLLWSKGQMENFKPSKKPVSVSKLFTDIENNFLGTTNVKICFSNEQQLSIFTDEDYLKTIMRNLTGNAVKALNGIEDATIEWRAWEENAQQFLSITDNGAGVSDQQLHALNNSDALVGIKSGLGLHLVRDMAKAIACTISVNSIPGKGTSFQLAI
ncbi:MAG: tetratricopeptide repeat protein [Chitinophagaceae bacterium]